MSGTKTRDKIISTAVGLFNKKGTKAITTNHIAKAAGISPGNLYYYFRNKEEIIRVIFDQMIDFMESEQDFGSGGYVIPTLAHLEALFKELFTLFWDYRFFWLELNPLLNRDEELKKAFGRLQKKRLREIRKSIRDFMAEGVLKPLDENTLDFMAKTIWMYVCYWHSFLNAGSEKITADSIKGSIDMIGGLLIPYMSEDARREFTAGSHKKKNSS